MGALALKAAAPVVGRRVSYGPGTTTDLTAYAQWSLGRHEPAYRNVAVMLNKLLTIPLSTATWESEIASLLYFGKRTFATSRRAAQASSGVCGQSLWSITRIIAPNGNSRWPKQ